MVDIKQRAVIVSKQTTGIGPNRTTKTIVCSEPSPDALSAYASELAAKLDGVGKVQAQLLADSQETASFVGLRTQSIQLLRDSLFRLCEGYLGGALSNQQYDILMRRYQRYMIALLGIEQLTGITRLPSVTINAQALPDRMLGSGQVIRVQNFEKDVAHNQKLVSALEAAKNYPQLSAEQKTALDEELITLNHQIKTYESRNAPINRNTDQGMPVLRNDVIPLYAGQADVNYLGPTKYVPAIAQAVKDIVIKAMDTDELGQLCWGYVTDPTNSDASIKTLCRTYLDRANKATAVAIEAAQNLTETTMSGDNPIPAEKIEQIENVVESLRRALPGVQNMLRQPSAD